MPGLEHFTFFTVALGVTMRSIPACESQGCYYYRDAWIYIYIYKRLIVGYMDLISNIVTCS